MHTIKLWRDEKSWYATHSEPEVLVLFGTNTLPTNYTAAAEPAVVLAAIVKLNPDRIVTFAD